MNLRIIIALGAAAELAACAPAVRYHPEPIAPAATAARLESRTLSDPGLKQFMEETAGHPLSAWPPETWNLSDLTLAAYYFSPQLEIARDQAEAAKAAIITAGERPNPTLALAPGVPAPYLLDLALEFPVVRAGRRKIKVEQAKDLSAAAGYQVAAVAWRVRSGVRAAALDYAVSRRRVELAERETDLRSQQVKWLSARLAQGEASRPEVASAQWQLLNLRLASRTAEGRVQEARAALAAAIGAPVHALDGIKFSLAAFDHPPDAATVSAKAIQREAALNRLDVRQALAQYRAAQAALQLEIARQHPNFSLGPGYQFEESDNFFTLAFSTVLPVFNRNQGPIAEAEARRKQAAAAFLEAQANAIAQSEEALAQYRAADAALDDARKSAAQIRQVQEPMAARAVRFGESDKLFLNSVELEGVAAVAAQLTALDQAQKALGRLEDAVERPLGEER